MRDRHRYSILEFDPSRAAVIEPPSRPKPIRYSESCVVCFFQEVLTKLKRAGRLKLVQNHYSELGIHPVYELRHRKKRVTVFHPGVGAPLAAGLLEEVIAAGCRKVIVCGSAGVLDKAIALGHIIVPDAAIRDEGTSYHYLPPGQKARPHPRAVATITAVCRRRGIAFLTGATWTTDAYYRETRAKVARRKKAGCLTVEMEAASFFAVAHFRRIVLGQLLYGGDDVSGKTWDPRPEFRRHSAREKLFWLAIEAVCRL